MSNSGLYSSIYEQVQKYAEIVDEVLISLKSGTAIANPNVERLAQLLDDLTQTEHNDLSLKIISMMMDADDDKNRAKWKRLSQELRSDSPDASTIEVLEELAHHLEFQQSEALAKMRGWIK